jgi:hypothetical protein
VRYLLRPAVAQDRLGPRADRRRVESAIVVAMARVKRGAPELAGGLAAAPDRTRNRLDAFWLPDIACGPSTIVLSTLLLLVLDIRRRDGEG